MNRSSFRSFGEGLVLQRGLCLLVRDTFRLVSAPTFSGEESSTSSPGATGRCPYTESASWARQRRALTFRGPRRLLRHLKAHGNVQELLIAVSIPHKQLLVLGDLFAALIKYLPLTLHCNQVLLLGEPGTVDIRHPVPCTSFSIYKVAQMTIFKDLKDTRHEI